MQRLTLVSYAVASALVAPLGVSASPFARPTRRDPAVVPGYGYTGCYTEAHGGRALSGSAFFDDQLTAEKCAVACSGFKYFGLEYGRECYCGDAINQGSVETAATDCSFSCPGNSAQTCGAGNRLTLYTRASEAPAPALPSTYRSLGCHSEPTGGRALAAKVTRADDMTIQKCADICGASNFPVFGLEYYNECYCGVGLNPASASAPETDCSFPCAGNPNEKCGGDWRINVYEFSTDTTPPSSTAPSTPAPTTSVDGWASEGCYTEAHGQRALSDVSFYDDAMTLEKCATVCDGYNWFGVEYGRECYCGNTLNQGSVSAPAAECNYPCPGKLSQTCGAGNRLNLYSAEDCSDDEDDVVTSTSTTSSSIDVPTSTSAPEETTTSAPEETTTSAPEETTTSAPEETTTSAPEETTTSAPEETTTSAPAETTTSAPEETTTSAPEETTTSAPAETTTSAPAETTTSSEIPTTSSTTTSAPAPSATLLVNGDFEGNPSSWTTVTQSPNPNLFNYNLASTTVAHGGTQSGEFRWAAGTRSVDFNFSIRSQQMNPVRNTLYKVTGFQKSSHINGYMCSIFIYLETSLGASQFFTQRVGLTTDWVGFSTSAFSLSTSAQWLRIRLDARCTTAGSFSQPYSINIDDLAIEPFEFS